MNDAGSAYVFGPSGLPIDLLYFNAFAEDNIRVRCEWSTATEINNDYFTIEKANPQGFENLEGLSEWQPIGTVSGAGNSNTTLNYSFTDYSPSLGEGVGGWAYYRLKQTDFDGQYEYSDIIAVEMKQNENQLISNIYPNPTSGQFVIEMELTKPLEMELEMLNVIGQVVYREDLGRVIGSYSKQLNLKALAKGIYTLQLTSEESATTRKIMLK